MRPCKSSVLFVLFDCNQKAMIAAVYRSYVEVFLVRLCRMISPVSALTSCGK